MKNYMKRGNGLHRIGRLMLTEMLDDSCPFQKGDDFRLAWMSGIVIKQVGKWVIWWRTA